MTELTIDREFDELCPPLSAEEERLLEDGLLADGCTDPVIVWANHDDTILDGHNRYRLCRKHGLKFTTKSLSIGSREDAVAWIVRRQIGRRNLGESQRALLAAKLVNSHVGGDHRANSPDEITNKQAAEEFNVGERIVKEAKKVIAQGAKPLQQAVQAGEVTVHAAAAVAELPKAEQRKVVAQGPKAVKEKAKELKAEKQAVRQYKDTFDPATLASDSKDAFGASVPDGLELAFQLRTGFKEQRDKLTSIKTWVTQNINHAGAVLLAGAQQRLVTDIDNADRELKFSTPHCVCIYCHNKAPKVANCNACKGSGWINESIYKAAPKEMQRGKAKS